MKMQGKKNNTLHLLKGKLWASFYEAMLLYNSNWRDYVLGPIPNNWKNMNLSLWESTNSSEKLKKFTTK